MQKNAKYGLLLIPAILLLSAAPPASAIGPFNQSFGTTVTYTDLVSGAASCTSVSTLSGGQAIYAPDSPAVPYAIPSTVIVGGIQCAVTCYAPGDGTIQVRDVDDRVIDTYGVNCVPIPVCDAPTALSTGSADQPICVPQFNTSVGLGVVTVMSLLLVVVLRLRTPLQRQGAEPPRI